MFIKLFHFLSLFAYLNTITYESSETTVNNTFAGDSMIEFVLKDVMNIPIEGVMDDIEVPNDSYRLLKTTIHIIPAVLLVLSILLAGQVGRIIIIVHPFYKTKSVCLPSYYTHLFRFKPF